jgi:hypothetical protein
MNGGGKIVSGSPKKGVSKPLAEKTESVVAEDVEATNHNGDSHVNDGEEEDATTIDVNLVISFQFSCYLLRPLNGSKSCPFKPEVLLKTFLITTHMYELKCTSLGINSFKCIMAIEINSHLNRISTLY